MRALLSFVARGRTQAIFVAAACLLVPPFSFVSGGVVGLITLRVGFLDGAIILAATLALGGAFMLFTFDSLAPVTVFALFTGVPVLLLAAVLRATMSQGAALAAAGLMGGAVILGIHLLSEDPVQWWRGILEGFIVQPLGGAGGAQDTQARERLEEMVDALAPMMVTVPSGAVIGAMLVLWLSRWMHAVLDNPGGFGKEFRALRLDWRVAAVGLVIAGLAVFAPDLSSGLPRELLRLAVVLYVIQGIAIAHAVVRNRGVSVGWLVGMYLALLLIPAVAILLLAVAGLSDTWVDYRRRWAPGT